tara:strand:- start:1010 stop:1639 length:630 start_codon:yes stop_codon:yes gene_type:complete
MAFPDTPKTLISRLHLPEVDQKWQNNWQSFYDLYHSPIEMATLQAYSKNGWYSVSGELLEDTMSDIFMSIFQTHNKTSYDKDKSYRNYIKTIVYRRVIDRIRKMKDAHRSSSLDNMQDSGYTPESVISEDFVDKEFRKALLVTLLEDVSSRVSPMNYEIFERVKLIGDSPSDLAKYYNVTRNYIDNSVYKVMNVLKDLVKNPDYRKELL